MRRHAPRISERSRRNDERPDRDRARRPRRRGHGRGVHARAAQSGDRAELLRPGGRAAARAAAGARGRAVRDRRRQRRDPDDRPPRACEGARCAVSERTRRIVFVVAALGVAAILLWALAGLPSFGSHESAYARLLNSTTAKRRHVTDVVTATVFDYRGVDTFGEELLLFAAVVGATLLLREQREELHEPPSDQGLGRVAVSMSSAVRLVGVAII